MTHYTRSIGLAWAVCGVGERSGLRMTRPQTTGRSDPAQFRVRAAWSRVTQAGRTVERRGLLPLCTRSDVDRLGYAVNELDHLMGVDDCGQEQLQQVRQVEALHLEGGSGNGSDVADVEPRGRDRNDRLVQA